LAGRAGRASRSCPGVGLGALATNAPCDASRRAHRARCSEAGWQRTRDACRFGFTFARVLGLLWSRVNALAPRRALERPNCYRPRAPAALAVMPLAILGNVGPTACGYRPPPARGLARPASGDDVIVRTAVVGAITSPLSRRSGPILTIASVARCAALPVVGQASAVDVCGAGALARGQR
jgi:hypothetical protein